MFILSLIGPCFVLFWFTKNVYPLAISNLFTCRQHHKIALSWLGTEIIGKDKQKYLFIIRMRTVF